MRKIHSRCYQQTKKAMPILSTIVFEESLVTHQQTFFYYILFDLNLNFLNYIKTTKFKYWCIRRPQCNKFISVTAIKIIHILTYFGDNGLDRLNSHSEFSLADGNTATKAGDL